MFKIEKKDFLVKIKELLHFYYLRNHHALFEIDKTVLTRLDLTIRAFV